MKFPTALVPVDKIAPLIKTIREQRVILDSDLALVYGVETKALNRAVKRNAKRFPGEFVFILEPEEVAALRCQFGTLKPGRGQHRKYPPYAFTEHGALMAATVLNSPPSGQNEPLHHSSLRENARGTERQRLHPQTPG